MKSWKKLFLVALTGVTTGVVQAGSCDTSKDCCGDVTADCRGGRHTSKSVFVDVGFGQSGTYLHDSMFRNDLMERKDDRFGGAFQIVGFGGKTTDKGKAELGRWFGLGHKSSMVVAEDQAVAVIAPNNEGARDIDAKHFNIRTTGETFSSTISFCPEQKFGGVLLSWKQALCRNDDDSVRWWAEVNAPIVNVKHNMGFVESNVVDGGAVLADLGLDGVAPVTNMTDAFKQASWKYGKIGSSSSSCDSSCSDSKTELANLELKLGYNSVTGDCCNYGYYVGFVAKSTSNRTAEFLFEPIAGQEHYALMLGSDIGFKVREWDESSLHVNFNIDARYWFEGNETRSFDLVGKEWSRYMEMYESFDQAVTANNDTSIIAGTSGINLMTFCVDVDPGYQLNYNSALVYQGCKFIAEIGHTLYARQAEEICPADFKANIAPVLKGSGGDGTFGIARLIGRENAGADLVHSQANYDIAKIKKCDIDWNSGAHPGLIGHTIYGSLGYDWDMCYPTLVSVGGSYDFSQGNAHMHRWTLFGKLGVSF